MAASKPITVA